MANGDRVFLYEFWLHWRHSTRGYGRRTVVPSAEDAEKAISLGRDMLDNGDEFDLISMQRRSIVGRKDDNTNL